MSMVHIFQVMLMAATPIIELRGAIPFGLYMGMPYWETFLFAVLGNLIPVPFIIIFIRPVFDFLEHKTKLKKLVQYFEHKANTKAEKIRKYELWGLFIFVAIPLPGTGAWTGALIASALGMRVKHSFIMISLGVICAGLIMLLLSRLGIMVLN